MKFSSAKYFNIATFEASAAVYLRIPFCRDVTLYQWVIGYRRFEATYSPHTEASEVQILNSDVSR